MATNIVTWTEFADTPAPKRRTRIPPAGTLNLHPKKKSALAPSPELEVVDGPHCVR